MSVYALAKLFETKNINKDYNDLIKKMTESNPENRIHMKSVIKLCDSLISKY